MRPRSFQAYVETWYETEHLFSGCNRCASCANGRDLIGEELIESSDSDDLVYSTLHQSRHFLIDIKCAGLSV